MGVRSVRSLHFLRLVSGTWLSAKGRPLGLTPGIFENSALCRHRNWLLVRCRSSKENVVPLQTLNIKLLEEKIIVFDNLFFVKIDVQNHVAWSVSKTAWSPCFLMPKPRHGFAVHVHPIRNNFCWVAGSKKLLSVRLLWLVC